MTDKLYRHYVLIVDRSGSMADIKDEAENGIRHFVKEQAALPGRATLSLYQFDTKHETVYDFSPIAEATDYELVPRGMTALLDACGFAITEVGEKLKGLPEDERPGKVIILITTDGLENSSHEYTKAQVKALITQQQGKYGWQFSYIGANQDAFDEASNLGIHMQSTLNSSGTKASTQSAYASASAASLRYASGQTATMDFLASEQWDAEEK